MRSSIRPRLRALVMLVAVLLAAPGLPAAAQGAGSHSAGDSTVTATDAWTYESDYSTPSSAFFMHARLAVTAFAYLETAAIGSPDVDTALDEFASGSTGSFDPGTTYVVLSGMTGGDTGWRLYVASASGIPTAFLITANVTAQPGTNLLSLLMAPVGSFDMAFEDARDGIQIDGQPAPFAGLDLPLLLGALEEDDLSTSPSPAPASQPGVVDGVDYRAIDAPTGCDRVGWAITDPTDLPATEAEIEQRGACAGGASFVAKCGTVPGERSDTRYITCEVTALVTDGPQEFGFDMFELFEADGDSEYVDLSMSFGREDLFPSGEVSENTTVSGTASFALDATATEPLLLEIRPPSLPAGAETAVIVIDGPLQDFTDFLE